MLGRRIGLFGSEFLKGHLVLRVVSPSREDGISFRRQRLHSILPRLDPAPLSVEVVQTLHLRPEIPISSADFEPILQIFTLGNDQFLGVQAKTFPCALSDGLHYIRALLLVPEDFEQPWVPLQNSLLRLSSFHVDFEHQGLLVVSRFTVLSTGSKHLGNPSDIAARPRKILVADILYVLFSTISDTCLPLPSPDATPFRDSIGVLAACALVNTMWNTLATPYLYRHVVLPNRGPAHNTTTALLSSLRSNSKLKPFIQTLHHPILKTVSLRERCVSSKLHLLLLPTFYPSLTIIRGLVIDPFNIAILAFLSRHAPSLRELSLEVTFASHERNTADFRNARGIGTIDLPSSLETLSLSMDVGVSYSQYILKRLVETGESTLGGGVVLRNLPNLRRLTIEFLVHGDSGQDAVSLRSRRQPSGTSKASQSIRILSYPPRPHGEALGRHSRALRRSLPASSLPPRLSLHPNPRRRWTSP